MKSNRMSWWRLLDSLLSLLDPAEMLSASFVVLHQRSVGVELCERLCKVL